MKIPLLYQIESYCRNIRKRIESIKIIRSQNKSFEKNFKNTKKMIVFVNLEHNEFSGGIMVMFYLAIISRRLRFIHGCDVLHATFFTDTGIYYDKQKRFKNNETIYRLKQVMEHAQNLDTLIIHIPELLMENFAKKLTPEYKKILKEIPNFQINILNQNIEVFSSPETWQDLKELTDNITQTTGFDKYTTQEVCDKYQVPLYKLIGYSNAHEDYKKFDLNQKEKLFIYSPDQHIYKNNVLNILKEGLPDFNFQQIQGLTFNEFMNTAQRAMFSITFGEGFDGYFTNMYFVGGVGFSVYNETFFPTKEYLKFPTVYENYEKLSENIVKDVRYYLENPEVYKELSTKIEALNNETAYNKQLTIDLMEKFYKKEPTFLPNRKF